MKLLPSMNDMFDDFFDDAFFAPRKAQQMLCDIKETDHNYEMILALPGFKKEDIKLDLTNGYLNITAQSQNDNEEKDKEGRIIRQERYHGSCSRSFYVGDGLKQEDIQARFDNGELFIDIPKTHLKEDEETKKYINII